MLLLSQLEQYLLVKAMNIKEYLETSRVTQEEFAKKIGVTQGFVSQLVLGKRPIPPTLVIDIEKATNGVVSRYELRPDVYPLEEVANG